MEAGQNAIVLRLGRHERTETREGLHLALPPPIERVEIANVNSIQREEFGVRGPGVEEQGAALHEAAMQTSDNNIVHLGFVVQYRTKDAFQARYRVSSRGKDFALTLAAEKRGERLVLLGIDPLGTSVFALVQEGTEVHRERHLRPLFPFAPENVLRDLILARWAPLAETRDATWTREGDATTITRPARSKSTPSDVPIGLALTPAAQNTFRSAMNSSPTLTPCGVMPVTLALRRTSTPMRSRSRRARSASSGGKASSSRGPPSNRMTRVVRVSMWR